MKYINLEPSRALDNFVRKHCSSLAQRLDSHPKKLVTSVIDGLSKQLRRQTEKQERSRKTLEVLSQ